MSVYDPATGSRTSTQTADSPEPESDAGDTSAPLAGLLTGRTLTRKRVYYVYASASLLVSFAPDVIVAGILTGHQADVLTASAALASSILLKVGVAFGFVAASNTGR